MKLTCIKPKYAHWGSILIEGQEYEGVIEMRSTEIITDYDNYWKYTTMILESRDWIRKGYDQSNLHEVIPGYKSLSEVNNLYTKRVDMPFITIKCSDNQSNSFCLLTDNEVYDLGADKSKDGNNKGKPCFSYTVYRVDDYFDYKPSRRDNILNQLDI